MNEFVLVKEENKLIRLKKLEISGNGISSKKYEQIKNENHKFCDDNINFAIRKSCSEELMKELGLIVSASNLTYSFEETKIQSSLLIQYGRKLIIVDKPANAPENSIPVHVFTKPGIELLKLALPTYREDYLLAVANYFKREKLLWKKIKKDVKRWKELLFQIKCKKRLW